MNTILPFIAAYYSKKNRDRISSLAVADLDTSEHLWGDVDLNISFRNVLVGDPEKRGELWNAWIGAGEVEMAEEAAFYVLQQTCLINGRKISRWAVMAAVEVDNTQIFLHEDVFPEGVERARQSIEACEGDMAPIFMGCSEEIEGSLRDFLSKAVGQRAKLLEYTESSTSNHKIWQINDFKFSLSLQEMFDERSLYVLDGHHRLAAARKNLRLGIGDGKILACVCSMEAEDTLILPIHRAIYCRRWALQEAFHADLVSAGCKIIDSGVRPQEIENALSQIPAGQASGFVLYAHSDRGHMIHFPQAKALAPQLANLPVAILDYTVLAPLSDLTVIPVPDFKLTLDQLAMDQAQVAFFLPPVAAEEVRAVAKAGLKMPRKSTRFVPKPALGLLCRPWM